MQSQNEQTIDLSDKVVDLKEEMNTTTPAEVVEEVIEEVNTLSETTAATAAVQKPKAAPSSSEPDKPTKIEATKPVEKTVTAPLPDCMILIGAYGDARNKQNLIATLNAQGYKVFQKPFRGLTRIGIFHPCSEKSLNDKLAEIRRKYAKDAFILEAQWYLSSY